MNERAYLLVEVLLVLGLVSILATIVSLPLKALDRQQAQVELDNLVEDLAYVRNRSNQDNGNYQVQIDTNKNAYSLVVDGKKEEILLKSSLKFISSNFSNGRINFTNGGVSKGGTIVLRLAGERLEISIPPVYPSINIKYEKR